MLNTPRRAVTESEVDAFDRDGFVVLGEVLHPDALTILEPAVDRVIRSGGVRDVTAEVIRASLSDPRVLFDRAAAAPWLAPRGHFYVGYNIARVEPAAREVALGGALGQIAAALLRATEVRYCDDLLVVKEPGSEEPTEWHDDDPFSVASGRARCALWCPLDDVSVEAGALWYLRGSHRRFANWREQGLDAAALTADHQEDLCACPVRRGDIVAHYPATIHGAGGNTTTGRRRALAIRFAGETARFVLPPSRNEPREFFGLADGEPLGGPQFPIAWSSREHTSGRG